MIHQDARLALEPYEFAAARRLAGELGVSGVLAQVLVRRGLGEPAAARAFLAAADEHPLDAFGGLRDARGADPRATSAAARGSPSTATTTWTASAPRRC